MLERIASYWDDHDAVDASTQADINRVLRIHLPAILDFSSPADAAGLARLLSEEVGDILDRDWDPINRHFRDIPN
jgi:hypothetical protein